LNELVVVFFLFFSLGDNFVFLCEVWGLVERILPVSYLHVLLVFRGTIRRQSRFHFPAHGPSLYVICREFRTAKTSSRRAVALSKSFKTVLNVFERHKHRCQKRQLFFCFFFTKVGRRRYNTPNIWRRVDWNAHGTV